LIKNVIWASLFALIAALLQSTLLRRLAIYHSVPDFALTILVFSAYANGSMTGQLTGFFSGLMLDFLSAAPLGLNALIRTITGALVGTIKGTFILDAIFMPMLLCAAATLLKALLLLALHMVFAEGVRAYLFTAPILWVELVLNTVTAPIIFALLNRFQSVLIKKKEV
jgi:rod shape-determining protein MreD